MVLRAVLALWGTAALVWWWEELYRAIRTARLRRLPDFDLRPIDVMVYHGP